MYSHGSNVGKVLGNVIGMLAKNHLFFIPVLTPPPAAAPHANADRLREQVGRARRAQRLNPDRGRHGLPHPT